MLGLIQRAHGMAAVALMLAAAPALAEKGRFADPLDTPAAASALAPRAMVNGLASSGSRLVAVGQRGHILYSDDRGHSWTQASVPVSVDMLAVTFPAPRLGWAVGHDGVILHSNDAGASWQLQADNRKDPQSTGRALLDVWFDDPQNGMAVGSFGMALCTGDGGQHWNHCEDRTDNPGGMHMNAIRYVGGAVYIVGEQGLLLKRGEGGRYAALASPYKGSFFGITGNSITVLAFGMRGNAYASDDGGTSWCHVPSGVQSGLTAGAALPDGSLVIASQSGQLLRSDDSGRNFRPVIQQRAAPATAMLAVDGKRVLVGGARGLQVQPLE